MVVAAADSVVAVVEVAMEVVAVVVEEDGIVTTREYILSNTIHIESDADCNDPAMEVAVDISLVEVVEDIPEVEAVVTRAVEVDMVEVCISR